MSSICRLIDSTIVERVDHLNYHLSKLGNVEDAIRHFSDSNSDHDFGIHLHLLSTVLIDDLVKIYDEITLREKINDEPQLISIEHHQYIYSYLELLWMLCFFTPVNTVICIDNVEYPSCFKLSSMFFSQLQELIHCYQPDSNWIMRCFDIFVKISYHKLFCGFVLQRNIKRIVLFCMISAHSLNLKCCPDFSNLENFAIYGDFKSMVVIELCNAVKGPNWLKYLSQQYFLKILLSQNGLEVVIFSFLKNYSDDDTNYLVYLSKLVTNASIICENKQLFWSEISRQLYDLLKNNIFSENQLMLKLLIMMITRLASIKPDIAIENIFDPLIKPIFDILSKESTINVVNEVSSQVIFKVIHSMLSLIPPLKPLVAALDNSSISSLLLYISGSCYGSKNETVSLIQDSCALRFQLKDENRIDVIFKALLYNFDFRHIIVEDSGRILISENLLKEQIVILQEILFIIELFQQESRAYNVQKLLEMNKLCFFSLQVCNIFENVPKICDDTIISNLYSICLNGFLNRNDSLNNLPSFKKYSSDQLSTSLGLLFLIIQQKINLSDLLQNGCEILRILHSFIYNYLENIQDISFTENDKELEEDNTIEIVFEIIANILKFGSSNRSMEERNIFRKIVTLLQVVVVQDNEKRSTIANDLCILILAHLSNNAFYEEVDLEANIIANDFDTFLSNYAMTYLHHSEAPLRAYGIRLVLSRLVNLKDMTSCDILKAFNHIKFLLEDNDSFVYLCCINNIRMLCKYDCSLIIEQLLCYISETNVQVHRRNTIIIETIISILKLYHIKSHISLSKLIVTSIKLIRSLPLQNVYVDLVDKNVDLITCKFISALEACNFESIGYAADYVYLRQSAIQLLTQAVVCLGVGAYKFIDDILDIASGVLSLEKRYSQSCRASRRVITYMIHQIILSMRDKLILLSNMNEVPYLQMILKMLKCCEDDKDNIVQLHCSAALSELDSLVVEQLNPCNRKLLRIII